MQRFRMAMGLALVLASGCGDDDGAGEMGQRDDSSREQAESDESGAEVAGRADGGAGDEALPASGSAGQGASEAPSDPRMATVADGVLKGDVVEGSVRFLKIPYAKPPVGALRWKAPQPPEPWDGVRHETEFASPCPQQMSQQSPESTNEDCLYLNVWRPEEPVEKAPVMVWIHGGGNATGSAADLVPTSTDHLWYDGKVFAARHGVVVVTLNYRLGVFGFFAHPALVDEGSPQGNQGLLDQQHALRWVRDNIAAFGGDPDNVTIFGESAGSADVCLHMVSPGSRGLFHRAISESGGCTTGRGENVEEAVAAVVQWAKDVGCDTEDVLDCLRDKPVEELVDLEPTDRTMGSTSSAPRIFNIIVDGEGGFLPESARTLMDRGELADVPYILGSNSEEGQLYLVFASDIPEDDEQYLAALEADYGDFAQRVMDQYPVSRFDGDYRKALARVRGDSGLVCGTHDSARRVAAAGNTVYMYNFNIPWSISREALGPTHASEISHVFGTPYNETEENEAVAVEMNAYWARFAATGDPNDDSAPVQWPQFQPDDNDDDLRVQFDPDYDLLESFRKDDCAMWREYYAR